MAAEVPDEYGFVPRVLCGCIFSGVLSYAMPALIRWEFNPGEWPEAFRIIALAGVYLSFRIAFKRSEGGQ